MTEKKYDIIIVGAGAAGLTAAIYARRANKTVLVLDKLTYGGQVVQTTRIENYPANPHISGVEFAQQTYDQAKALGAKFIFEEVLEIKKGNGFVVKTTEQIYSADAVIIATGSHERRLELENEDKFTGRGISYCASCDGGFFKDKIVAINGGGNTALYSSLYLSDIAKKVYLIHRSERMKAEHSLVEKAKAKENVHFILKATITKLIGNRKLEKINYETPDGKHVLSVDGLFVTIGRIPSTKFVKDFVELDSSGYIKSDETCKTSVKGVFVAGDNRAKPIHQLVTATADGATAATAAIDYLNKGVKHV